MTGIEITRYLYGRYLFPNAFSEIKPHSQEKRQTLQPLRKSYILSDLGRKDVQSLSCTRFDSRSFKNSRSCSFVWVYFSLFLKTNDSFKPLTAEWVLRALIDFTLTNARRFYSSTGNPLDGKGLRLMASVDNWQLTHPKKPEKFGTFMKQALC